MAAFLPAFKLYRHFKKVKISRKTISRPLVLAVVASLISPFAGTPAANAAAGSVTNSSCSTTVGETTSASVLQVGNDCVLTFTSGSNSWTPPTDVREIDLLVVGGGGSGGARHGGGGGAGGLVYLTNVTVAPGTPINVTVGSGGTPTSARGNTGGDSSFALTSTITAKGGGAGGSCMGGVAQCAGAIGGSSGGSAGSDYDTEAANQSTQNYGFGNRGAKGSVGASWNWTGGGGGGAGGAGTAGNTNGTSGTGGAGKSISITGSSVCYAGGGGGGNEFSTASATGSGGSCGGTAIGGAGSKGNNAAGSGAANTGSGGGGSGFQDGQASGNGNGTPGAGGSGVVIIRWTLPSVASAFPNVSGMSARFNASNFNTTLNSGNGTWADTSGSGYHIAGSDITGGSTGAMSSVTSAAANGSANTFTVVQGSTASTISMLTSAEMTGKYTLFTVARYNAGTKGRIFQGTTGNWLHGFYGGWNGVMHKEGWYTPYADYFGNNWVMSSECSHDASPVSNSCTGTYSAQGKQKSHTVNTISTAYGLAVNTGAHSTEDSDYQIADVLVFNRVLSIVEENQVETYLSKKYGIAVHSDLAANYDPGAAANGYTNGAAIASTATMKDVKKDTSDSLVLTDSLDMTLYNNPTYSSENGGIINFSNSAASWGQTASNIRPLPKFSASVWAKFTGTQTTADFSTLITQPYTPGYIFSPVIVYKPSNGAGIVNGAFYDGANWRTAYGTNITSGAQVTADNWNHFTATYDGVSVAFYLNGVLQSSSSTTANALRETVLRIAMRWDGAAYGGGTSFNGSLGLIKVYDHGLSQAEVTADYNSAASRYFVNTVAPSVSGTVRAGQTLTASNGTWSGATIAGYTYQWSRATTSGGTYSNISGATASTYVVADGDADKYLKVTVTASSSMGSVSSTSTATSIVTINCSEDKKTENGYTTVQIKYVGSCIWKSPENITKVKALLVGGGGGGGAWVAGGGGGGGVLENSSVTVSPNTEYNFFIASGGTGSIMTSGASFTAGTNGGDTTALGLTAYGGGLGGSWDKLGLSRATGGGGSISNYATPLVSTYAGQGFIGGIDGYNGDHGYPTGGGGGAGAVGQAGIVTSNVSSKSGNGGAGKATDITGSTLYFGGGGGGGCHGNSYYPCTTGTGGTGGGGNGGGNGVISSQYLTRSTTLVGSAGSANTGGGGGGAGAPSANVWSVNSQGGAGGSGIVIISYVSTYTVTYNYDSATGGNSTTSATYAPGATALVLPTPTKTNSIFGGWYSDSGLTTAAGAGGANYTPSGTTTAITLYAKWLPELIFYDSLTGSTGTDMNANASSNSSGLTNNWTKVNANKQNGTAGFASVFGANSNFSFPANSGFTVPASNIAANGDSATYNLRYSARQITNPIDFDANATYFMSYLVIPGSTTTNGSGMVGLLNGLPTSTTDSTKTALLTGFSYNGTFSIDKDDASDANWVDSTYQAASSTVYSTSERAASYFVLVKYTSVASGNDIVRIKAYKSNQSLPTSAPDDSAWDATYQTALTGNFTHLAVQLEFISVVDEIRMGYTYNSVTNVLPTRTVTFKGNYTGVGSDTTQSILDSRSTALTSNAFTRTGYTFGGWATAADGTGTSYTDGQSVSLTADLTLHAKWTANSNTFVFNNNTGSGTIANQTITSGTATALTTNTFTKTGYTFANWNTQANGSGTSYTDGQSITITSGTTLYAQWTADANTFTFNNNTGTGTMANQSITTGTATALSSNTFTKTGYTFTGWNTQANASGTSYTDGQSITIAAGATLYAQWTANSNTFAYNGNTSDGGTTPTGGGSKNFGSTVTVAANTFTKTGYTFANWNTAADGSGTTYAGTGSVTFTMPDAAVTLYAQWTLKTYAITFKSGTAGSGADQILSKTHGTALTTPDATTANSYFTRTGYTVSGWSGTDGGSQSYALGASYTTEATANLYPVWSAGTNTVVYDVNGGSSVSDGSFLTGGTISKPTNPTKSKKIFGGWSTSETSDQGNIANLIRTWPYSPTATSGITLYAIWHDDYSVNFAGIARTSLRASNQVLANNSSFSWEAWIYPTGSYTGSTQWFSILENGYTGNNYGRIWMDVVDSGSGPYLSGGHWVDANNGTGFSAPVNSITYNTWQHVAVTYERTGSAEGSCSGSGGLQIKAYVDGVLVQTATDSVFAGCINSPGLMIGDKNIAANQRFIGRVDQVKIWNGALTLAEIESSRTNYSVGSVDNSLRAHYGFNELGSSPALNNVAKNLASEASTYDLTIYGASSTDVTNNLTRFQNSYQVSYSGNTSDSGSVSAQTALLPYEIITNSTEGDLAKTGYTFSSWNTLANGSGTSISTGASLTSLYGNTALYAKWTANSNTVTFNANDGSGTPATSTQTITSGAATALTANSFTRTGYTFAGWDAAADGSGTDYTNQQSVTITGSMTLYAKWTANSNTFIFNNNTGSGTMSNQSITTGTATAISTNIFTKNGYSFTGWNTAANGSGTSYTDGQSITVTAGTTLFAQWSAATNTITFNNNAGSGTMANQSITSGTATALNTNTFTKTGYTFAGWNTLAAGGGTSYTNGQSLTVTSGATLFAQWTANSNTFAYNGNSNSGGTTPAGGGSKNYGATITVAANTFTKSGYSFSGWNTAANGSGTSYAGTGLITFTMPDAAVTLYAQWEVISCSPTSTISGGYKIFTFTSTSACFWNVPSDISAVDVLVVGGGGGGAGNKTPRTYDGAGAGGGGGAYLANSVNISGAVEIAVGTGGTGGTTTSTGAGAVGGQGSQSYFATITAGGGGGGGCDSTAGLNLACNTAAMSGSNGTAGGGGGGASNYYNAYSFGNGGTGASVTIGGTTYAAQNGFRGGYYNDGGTSVTSTGGPGGGARTAANRNTPGSGLVSSFTGTSAEYGKGGSAYGVASWTFRSTTSGYGTGGDGAYHASAATNGASGANGVVLVRYAIPSITYAAGTGGSGTAPTSPSYVDFGATFTTPANTFNRTGYTFAAWSDGTNTYAAGATYPATGTISANVTLTATWTINSYSFAYNGNNSDGGSAPASSVTTDYGTTVTVAANSFTRTGYTFASWNTAANGSGTTYAGTGSVTFTMPDAAVTLYVQWTANANTLTYNGNTSDGGTTPSGGGSKNFGSTITVAANTYTKTGYTFASWNTAANGSGTTYAGTGAVTFTMPNASVTLYAQWTANSNTFVFNNNTGTGTMANQSITSNVATALTANTFTKTGFTFSGWNTLANGSGTSYTDGESITITAGTTLYAQWTVNGNTFAYNGNTSDGGSAPAGGGSKNYATTVTVAANTYTKAGYTFSGWNTAANGSGTTYAGTGAVTFSMPDAAVTLYAQWTINSNTFAYNGNTSDGGSAPTGGGSKNYATTITVAANSFTKTGFTFTGWNTVANGSGTAYAGTGAVTFSMPDAAVTLYAQWTGDANNFVFDSNTGSGTMTTQSITSGTATALTSNTFTKSGYTFSSWNTSANGSGTSYTDGQSITITAGATLYAQWTANSNSFVFDSNTGSGTMATQSITSGTPTALTTNSFTKAGYTFAGWNTAANNSGTSYSNSQSITITAGATLYAQWTINANTFAYNGNTSDGGSAPSGGGTKNYATTITVAANSYTKTGYTFDSWNTAANGSGTSYADTGSVTFSMPDAAVTLYAQWIANTNTFAYNGNTSTSGSAPTGGGAKSYGVTITVAANSYTKTGYSFTGWNTAANGSGTTYAGTGSVTFLMPDAAVTLYAQWSANTLVITFNSQGGSNVTAGSTVTAGSISAAPTPPTKANYEFAGWATSIGGTAITFAYTHGQTADFTLYALWTANQYTVTYVYNSATSGNGTASASFTTGGTAITLPTPLRTGYNFDGWYSDSLFANSIGAAGGSYSPTGSSLTLSAYAKWVAINYTVTYSAAVTTSGTVPVDSSNYIYANNVIIKGNTGSLVRTGYTFLGWTSASDGSSTLLTSGSTFSTPAANMTFYAKWSANTYTVTYNKNGASGSPTLTSDSYTTGGTAVTLTSVGNMVKTGFDFSGWSATPTGSVLSGGYTTTSNVTLYAIWTIKTIAITFAKGSAINEAFFNFPANRSASYGTLITLSDTIDSSIDIAGVSHAFMGWNDGNSIYQSGATYLLGETAPTFTAVWVKIYAVRYAFNGGTAAVSTSAIDGECQQAGSTCLNGQVITSNAAPTKTGYEFAGWVDQNNLSVPTAATFTVSSSRYLIYATWTAINYAITYEANGGATTPASFTKQISQSFSVATAITRTGYTFSGWSDGTSVFGAGATYYVSSSPVTLTAQWTANVYTVIYDWNGGSGSTTTNTSYTVGTSAITLPVVGDHVKDGYNFSGWSTSSNGNLISGGYTPTADITLYAIWGTGSYTVSYNANYGTVSTSSESILNGTSLTLPTPTRDNFVFDGWYTALTGGSKVGNAAESHQPTQSKTLYARWIQSSIYGIDPATLTRLGVTTARTGTTATFLGSNATSSVSVTVPAGSLPDGTTVNFDLVGDYARAQSVLTGTNNYIISMVVSWLAPDQTVPNTNSGKAISLTITNSSIKAGASVYAIVAGTATLMGTATQDGTVTVAITSDPEVVVITTKPTAPTSVSATSNAARESLVSWSAPSTDGGSAITGYTVTASNNQTCTTSTTSCTVTGLLDATSYTFTVTATNSVGTSVASTSASATTAGKPTAPTALSATSNEIQQTVLTWTAPSSNGGSAITGYTVTANTGATCSTTVLTTCVISGLTNGVTYTFTVTAMNIAGTSPASSSASATTANIPGAPTSVTASSGEIQQSVISWSAPASNGGSSITGYTVTSNTGATCTTTTTTCTITGLSDGVTYTFTVVATNAVGPSSASSSATAKTVELPGAPTSVAASSGGDKRSVISWTAPSSNGGSTITGYTVTSNTGATCTTTTTTCTITGFNDGTTYTFTVIATNILGDSLASVSASGRTADAVVVAPPVIWVSAQPAPAPAPVVPSQPETPLTVVGSNEVKVPALEVKPVETKPVDPKPIEVTPEVKPEVKPEIKPTTVSVDAASKKFISEVKIVNGEVILLPELGFSGKKTVTVTISENGVERSVKIALVVLPEVVTKPTIVPAKSARSTIRWTESPNATSYTVYLDGKKVCTTSGTNCTINKVLGPNASVEIVSNGGDKTLSQKVEAELKLASTVVLGQLVSTTLTKAILSPVDISTLTKISAVIKAQGFKNVVISEITTTKKTAALAEARMAAIKKFIKDKVGSASLKFEVVAPASRTYMNIISVKG